MGDLTPNEQAIYCNVQCYLDFKVSKEKNYSKQGVKSKGREGEKSRRWHFTILASLDLPFHSAPACFYQNSLSPRHFMSRNESASC